MKITLWSTNAVKIYRLTTFTLPGKTKHETEFGSTLNKARCRKKFCNKMADIHDNWLLNVFTSIYYYCYRRRNHHHHRYFRKTIVCVIGYTDVHIVLLLKHSCKTKTRTHFQSLTGNVNILKATIILHYTRILILSDPYGWSLHVGSLIIQNVTALAAPLKRALSEWVFEYVNTNTQY